ncbi:MAG: PD-(D/E)XK nuclease family protein [Gammaproteobacteria bacterium]|nr:PD-(D/E)XK nuclease family protein [Gammaproteobacteria bacterium]
MLTLGSELAAHLRNSGTLLVPSAEQARAVELAYARTQLAAGATVWTTPSVCTPAAWRRREAERQGAEAAEPWPRVLSAAEDWRLWHESVAAVAEGLALLDTAALASSLLQARTLALEYGLTVSGGPAQREAGLLHAVQSRFRERAAALEAAAADDLAARLASGPQLAAGGFLAPPPWVRARGRLLAPAVAAPLEDVALVRPADPEAELEAMCAWCVGELTRDPAAQLLLVVPGSGGRRERLAALLRQAIEPGALEGPHPERSAAVVQLDTEPLAVQALPAQALRALALVGGERAEFEEWAAFLNSPQWSLEPAARARIVQQLREARVASLDLREARARLPRSSLELRRAARELDVRLRAAAARLTGGRATPRQWAERWQAALAQLEWPGAVRLDEHAQRQRLAWHELLESFETLGRCVGTLERRSALTLLRELAARQPFAAEAALASVTLTGRLADPIARYDGLWVAGASADALPRPAAPDPFLPRAALLAAGVPAADAAGRAREAAMLLARWRAAAQGALVYSVARRVEDLEPAPSPLLRALPVRGTPGHTWLPLRWRRGGRIELFEDVRGRPWDATQRLGGTRTLVLQNLCPFRAYAEQRLGDQERWRADPGIAGDLRGRLLHAALQRLWEELADSRTLQALAPEALAALVGHCVTDAAQELQAEQYTPRRRRRAQYDLFARLPPAYLRECRRAQRLILRLCELERTRPPFTVSALEASHELVLGGGRVRLRLDRVDRTAQGELLVLDYKSGARSATDWTGPRPTHPQLLAYFAALGSAVAALATVELRAAGVAFRGVAAHADLLPKVAALGGGGEPEQAWLAQQARWRAYLAELIAAYLAGDARLDPLPGACRHCHVIDLCRVRESAAAAATGEEGEGA